MAFARQFGSNPLLRPDKSTQWGVGAVWAPAPGISLGLDYFDIRIRDAVTSTSGALVFLLCPDGIKGPTCRYIHRGPVDPNYPNLPGPIVLVDGALTKPWSATLTENF